MPFYCYIMNLEEDEKPFCQCGAPLLKASLGQQVPGWYRDVSRGQSPSEPVPGVPVKEVPAGGHEQRRYVSRVELLL